MSSLSDIFAVVRLSLDQAGFEAQAVGVANKTGTSVGKAMSANLTSQLKGALLGGLGFGAGMSAFQGVEQAVRTVVGAIGDAVNAANTQDASLARMDAALQANVTNWDGNTTAIEKTIAARLNLGFKDVELRDSFASLVAATHDVNQALAIQVVAMDLARFSHTDLATATSALVSIDAGRARGLAALGINVKDFSTIEERLTAVEKVAAGQAIAYGDTTTGVLDAVGAKADALNAKLGHELTPGVLGAADALRGLVDVMGSLDQAAGSSSGTWTDLERGWQMLTHPGTDFGLGFLTARQNAEQLAAQVAAIKKSMADLADADSAHRFAKQIEDVNVAVTALRVDVVSDNVKMAKSYKSLDDFLLGAFNVDFARASTIMDDRAALSANAAEAAALRAQIASGKLTAAQATDARTRIQDLEAENVKRYADLAAAGVLSTGDYAAWEATLQSLANSTKGAVHDAWLAALADMEALRTAAKTAINIAVNYRVTSTGQSFTGGIGGKAAGGPVDPTKSYIVGEVGPELFRPSVPGVIVPNYALHATLTPAGNGALTINGGIHISGVGSDVSPAAARNFGVAVMDVVANELRNQSSRVPTRGMG